MVTWADWQTVELTKVEMRIARAIGHLRYNESRRMGAIDRKLDQEAASGDAERIEQIDKLGAAAEMAYCKARGIYWEPRVNNFKEADVGQRIQIRATERPDGMLIIRPGDDPAHFYVLVVQVSTRVFRVVGFMKGEVAMAEDAYKWNPNKAGQCWMVPQAHLYHFPEPEKKL